MTGPTTTPGSTTIDSAKASRPKKYDLATFAEAAPSAATRVRAFSTNRAPSKAPISPFQMFSCDAPYSFGTRHPPEPVSLRSS